MRVGNLSDSRSWVGFELEEIREYEELKGLFELIELLISLDVHKLLNQTDSYTLIAKASFEILAISGNFPDVASRLEKDYKLKNRIDQKLVKLLILGSKEEDKVSKIKSQSQNLSKY